MAVVCPGARVFAYTRPTASSPVTPARVEALTKAGTTALFQERAGTPRERRRLFAQIAPGDTLILEGLEQLGTSFDDILRSFSFLLARGVTVRILDAGFTSEGHKNQAYRDVTDLFVAVRSTLTREAAKATSRASRAKGQKVPGVPSALTPEQWPEIKRRLQTEKREALAADLGVHRRTLWAYCRRMTVREETSAAPAPRLPRKAAEA